MTHRHVSTLNHQTPRSRWLIFPVVALVVAACGGGGADPTTATTTPQTGSQSTTTTTGSPGTTVPSGGGPTPTIPPGWMLKEPTSVAHVTASNGGVIFVAVVCDESREGGPDPTPTDSLHLIATGFPRLERFTVDEPPSDELPGVEGPLFGTVGPDGIGGASRSAYLVEDEYQVTIEIMGETLTATIAGCGE